MSFDEVLALIDRVTAVVDDTDERNKMLLYAGRIAGVKAEEIAGGYPEPSGKPLEAFYDRTDANGRAYKSKFKSFRQQRKVFALIKQGKVPYRRTGRLGASMTSAAYIIDTDVVIQVGTNDPKAPFVIGRQQSHYHIGVWPVLQTQIDAHADEIVSIFSAALGGYLRGYIAGKGR